MDFSLPGAPVVGSIISGFQSSPPQLSPQSSAATTTTDATITGMSYHESGKRLFVVSSPSSSSSSVSKIQVIDCLTGKSEFVSPLRNERDQMNLVEATYVFFILRLGLCVFCRIVFESVQRPPPSHCFSITHFVCFDTSSRSPSHRIASLQSPRTHRVDRTFGDGDVAADSAETRH